MTGGQHPQHGGSGGNNPNPPQPSPPQPSGGPSKFPHVQSILQIKIENPKAGYFKAQSEPHNIPGFPHNQGGSSKTIGLTAGNLKPIVVAADKKIDSASIYCTVYVTDQKVNEAGKNGYKVGLVVTAGFGVVHVGPLYAILTGPSDVDSMALEIDSPLLTGTARVTLAGGKDKNNVSLNADFQGKYSGNSSGSFPVNWDPTTK